MPGRPRQPDGSRRSEPFFPPPLTDARGVLPVVFGGDLEEPAAETPIAKDCVGKPAHSRHEVVMDDAQLAEHLVQREIPP